MRRGRTRPFWASAPGRGGPAITHRHDERELVVGHAGGRRRERLGALDQRQRLLVESGRAGAAHEAAAQESAVPVDAEREARDALLAAGLCRIALVALE